jgi:8-oxo-dGTP pyrophosphatase MutT (NUDIX family)
MNELLLSESGSESNQLALPYRGLKNSLFQYLDTLEKSKRFQSILIYSDDVKTLFEDLKSITTWIPAAGGVIENAEGKILLIKRRGYWDLPKGKLDRGETSKSAAIRECIEETGLGEILLGPKLHETYHIYRENNNQRVLKRTKWFAMNYNGSKQAIPQSEEGITQIVWEQPDQALNYTPMFENIKNVLRTFIQFKQDS